GTRCATVRGGRCLRLAPGLLSRPDCLFHCAVKRAPDLAAVRAADLFITLYVETGRTARQRIVDLRRENRIPIVNQGSIGMIAAYSFSKLLCESESVRPPCRCH